VLAHARALLTSAPGGQTAYFQADLRDPEKILASPVVAGTLDLTKPVALMPVAVLHFLTGVGGLVRTYRQAGIPAQARTAREFAALVFGGLDLADPGVVLVSDWRPPAAPRPVPPKSTGTAGSAASPRPSDAVPRYD